MNFLYKFLILLMCILFNVIYSLIGQTFEQKIFNNFAKEIINKNELLELNKEFQGVGLVIDPETGDTEIYFHNNLKKEIKEKFNSINSDKQLKIILAEKYPIFPLKDTLYVIDSSNFFINIETVIFDKYVFEIVRSEKRQVVENCIIISNMYLSGDELLILFRFKDDYSNNYVFYFDLKNIDLKFIKSRIASMKLAR